MHLNFQYDSNECEWECKKQKKDTTEKKNLLERKKSAKILFYCNFIPNFLTLTSVFTQVCNAGNNTHAHDGDDDTQSLHIFRQWINISWNISKKMVKLN